MRARDLFLGSFQMMNAYRKTFLMMGIPLFILNIFMNMASNAYTMNMFKRVVTNPIGYSPFAGMGWLFLVLMVTIFIGFALAVGWHRRALLDEAFEYASNRFFNRNIWSYFVGSLLILIIYFGIALMAVFAIMIMTAIINLFSDLPFLMIIIGFIFSLAGLAFLLWFAQFLLRISIILPSRAIGKPISIGRAYTTTIGQHWMLIRFILLTGFISMIVMSPMIIGAIYDQISFLNSIEAGNFDPNQFIQSKLASPAEIAFSSFFSTIWSFFSVGFLTILYAQFVNNND